MGLGPQWILWHDMSNRKACTGEIRTAYSILDGRPGIKLLDQRSNYQLLKTD
jgi:hypothetical protein